VARRFFEKKAGPRENRIGDRAGLDLRVYAVEGWQMGNEAHRDSKRLRRWLLPTVVTSAAIFTRTRPGPVRPRAPRPWLARLRAAWFARLRAAPIAIAAAFARAAAVAVIGTRIFALKIGVIIRARRLVHPR